MADGLITTALEQSGFMAALSAPPQPFAVDQFRLATEHGFEFTFKAKVLQRPEVIPIPV